MCSYMYIYTCIEVCACRLSSPPPRSRERERHDGGERETATWTNKVRTVKAWARAKGRRIGMRKLKRAVSPPSGEGEGGGANGEKPRLLYRLVSPPLSSSRLSTFPRASVFYSTWSRTAMVPQDSSESQCHQPRSGRVPRAEGLARSRIRRREPRGESPRPSYSRPIA